MWSMAARKQAYCWRIPEGARALLQNCWIRLVGEDLGTWAAVGFTGLFCRTAGSGNWGGFGYVDSCWVYRSDDNRTAGLGTGEDLGTHTAVGFTSLCLLQVWWYRTAGSGTGEDLGTHTAVGFTGLCLLQVWWYRTAVSGTGEDLGTQTAVGFTGLCLLQVWWYRTAGSGTGEDLGMQAVGFAGLCCTGVMMM